MGLLRFILAVSVIAEHSTPVFGLAFVGGHLAVKLFFIISGFYMALVLDTKYSNQPDRYWLFISNRFLRIYPSYFVVLFLSLVFYAAASVHLGMLADRLNLWLKASQNGDGLNLIWIGLSQITIVGMEVVSLFLYNFAHGFHLPDPLEAANAAGLSGIGISESVPAWRFLFVPQAWSIGLELIFYLIVPRLILWKSKNLILIGLLSASSHLVLGHYMNPNLFQVISYFFFPLQLFWFVLGILAYRSSNAYLANLSHFLQIGLMAFAFGMICLYQFLSFPFKETLCAASVFFSIPVLFAWTKNSQLNKYIGDLSYPLYIGHILVKWVLLAVMGVSIKGATCPGWLLLLCSTAFALVLLCVIDYRIDRWRQKRVSRGGFGNVLSSTHRKVDV